MACSPCGALAGLGNGPSPAQAEFEAWYNRQYPDVQEAVEEAPGQSLPEKALNLIDNIGGLIAGVYERYLIARAAFDEQAQRGFRPAQPVPWAPILIGGGVALFLLMRKGRR